MKKRILAAVLAVLMVMLLIPAVLMSNISAATIYKTDFESGDFSDETSPWTRGTYSVPIEEGDAPLNIPSGNKVLKFSSTAASSMIAFGSINIGNADMLTKAKYSEYSLGFDMVFKNYSTSESFSLYLRTQDNRNNRYNLSFTVGKDTGDLIISRRAASGSETNVTIYTNSSLRLANNTKYRVLITATGGTTNTVISVQINGVLVGQVTETSTTYTTGGILFYQFLSNTTTGRYAMVDNFKLTDPQTVTGTIGSSVPAYPETTDFDDASSAVSSSQASSNSASSSAASSSTATSSAATSSAATSSAATSATSSLGATGLPDITMGKTKNALLSENFNSTPINSAFNDMIAAGCSVVDGKLSNAGVTKDANNNIAKVFTTSDVSYSDYTFETDVTTNYATAYRFVEFLFRYEPVSKNHYVIRIGRYGDMANRSTNLQVWIYKREAGKSVYLVGESSATGIALAAGTGITETASTSYHLKVVLNGSNIKVYADDILLAEKTDSSFTSGGIGIGGISAFVTLDNFVVSNPLTLKGATFDLGADYANRKVELHSTVKTGTTNAQGLVTFTNIEAGTHQLKVYDAAGTNVAYTVDLFLAEGTALEAGGNGVNMTTAGATIVLRLVGTQLVITSASSGLGSAVITSQGPAPTGDTANVWMLLAIMAIAAGAVFTVKKIKV